MSLNYPANQDSTIESWTLTTAADQLASFGKIYGIGELVPVNYNEILINLIDLAIPYAPLREYVFISTKHGRTSLNNESGLHHQSTELATAMLELYLYWKEQILIEFGYPLGVVTLMSSKIIPNNEVSNPDFHLSITFKIQWFKIPPPPPKP